MLTRYCFCLPVLLYHFVGFFVDLFLDRFWLLLASLPAVCLPVCLFGVSSTSLLIRLIICFCHLLCIFVGPSPTMCVLQLCYKYVRVSSRELKRRCARYVNPLLGDVHGVICFDEVRSQRQPPL